MPPHAVNETKQAIVAVMREMGHPVSAEELYVLWKGTKNQAVFDYHLSTLVKAGIAKLVIGPQLRFCLVHAGETEASELLSRARCL
jgi:hypothetical protein